ncbi:MAG: hypothetical protein ACKV19_26280 [Verrucomicrobiales bacterium]
MKIEIGKSRQPREGDADYIIEFFRLMARLDRALNSGSKSPFFDAAGIIQPEAGDDFDSLLQGDEFAKLSLPAQRVCKWHLRFEMLPEEARAALCMTDSPFRPLIELLNSGGRFRVEDIFVDVGQMSIPWTTWRNLADSPPTPPRG